MTVNVTVTERAARKIGEILGREAAGTMLRVSVEGGGCSGFQYKFDTERAKADDDIVIERSRRHGADRSGVAQLHGGFRDRFRRRPDRVGLQGAESERHRLLRLRHELRALVLHVKTGRQPVRIATWNVNSIKQRLDGALAWLAERQPDIVCMQETKCVDDAFPREPFEALGYNLAIHGQKTFNGVALLSKFPFDEVTIGLPGDHSDDHARFIEGGGVDREGRDADCKHLSAQRQSAGHRQISVQDQLDEAAV